MLMYVYRSISIACLAVCVGLFLYILYYERKERMNFSNKPYKKFDLPITVAAITNIPFSIAGLVLFFASFFFTTDDQIGFVDPMEALVYSFFAGIGLFLILHNLYYKRCVIPFYEEHYPEEYNERKNIIGRGGGNEFESKNFTIFATSIISLCLLNAEIISFF